MKTLWAADMAQQLLLCYLMKKLVKSCMMFGEWVLCTSVEGSFFWSIRNVIGIFLPFFPWNMQQGHNTHSKLISVSVATIIKKMIKLHLSAPKYLWWREPFMKGSFWISCSANLSAAEQDDLQSAASVFYHGEAKRGLCLPQKTLTETYCYW